MTATKKPKGEYEIKAEKLALLKRKIALREGLPHKYGWKWYEWAWDFYSSQNKFCFLTAANQVSKSSTQIRKVIEWATNKKLWPELWDHNPTQFWYFYPTSKQATIEWTTKWSQFMPRNEFKESPIYGWKEEMKHGEIFAIHFFSGVHLYFKTYKQAGTALQTASVDYLALDEEVVADLFPELLFRISATNGYISMVFTATLGQELWRLTMEPEDHEIEKYPEAWKRTVSLYDCQIYTDGTPSHWTTEKIQMVVDRCPTHDEVLKRVWGKFIIGKTGRVYEQFNIKDHMRTIPHGPLYPSDWNVYSCVDPGGGEDSHPTGILFVAVRPDHRFARIFKAWRGDGVPTTASDALNKHSEIRNTHKIVITQQLFDWASKDFGTIARSIGEPFLEADKNTVKGEEIVNVLFKHNMLEIVDGDPELYKLAQELSTIRKNTKKNKRKDDLADPLRYICMAIPWDFSVIEGKVGEYPKHTEPNLTPLQKEIMERRKDFEGTDEERESRTISEEFNEYNELYGS